MEAQLILSRHFEKPQSRDRLATAFLKNKENKEKRRVP